VKAFEAQHQARDAFDPPTILLHDVVEVLTLANIHSPIIFKIELIYACFVSTTFVDIN